MYFFVKVINSFSDIVSLENNDISILNTAYAKCNTVCCIDIIMHIQIEFTTVNKYAGYHYDT